MASDVDALGVTFSKCKSNETAQINFMGTMSLHQRSLDRLCSVCEVGGPQKQFSQIWFPTKQLYAHAAVSPQYSAVW